MSGPIVRTGTTPKFWANWEQVFGDSKSPTDAPKKAKKKAAAASKSEKKSGKKSGKSKK